MTEPTDWNPQVKKLVKDHGPRIDTTRVPPGQCETSKPETPFSEQLIGCKKCNWEGKLCEYQCHACVPAPMFVTTRPCTYQEHAARIAQLMREGMHDGAHWKPEAPNRYAELEAQESAAPAPEVPAEEDDVLEDELLAANCPVEDISEWWRKKAVSLRSDLETAKRELAEREAQVKEARIRLRMTEATAHLCFTEWPESNSAALDAALQRAVEQERAKIAEFVEMTGRASSYSGDKQLVLLIAQAIHSGGEGKG